MWTLKTGVNGHLNKDGSDMRWRQWVTGEKVWVMVVCCELKGVGTAMTEIGLRGIDVVKTLTDS